MNNCSFVCAELSVPWIDIGLKVRLKGIELETS